MNPWLYIAALMGAGFAYKMTLVIRLLLGHARHLEADQDANKPVENKGQKKKSAAAAVSGSNHGAGDENRTRNQQLGRL